MSDLSATSAYERACEQRVAEATPSTYGATRIEYAAGGMHDELLARIAELEAENQTQIYNATFWRKKSYKTEAERDKWEWVARDACGELAYETHVNPQSPLDYRLAHWPPLPSPPSGCIRGYSHDCKGEIHGDDSSVPYPARADEG